MSEKLEIDQDKIVHENLYKVNLGLEIPEVKDVIPPTQINTEENQVEAGDEIVENKPIVTDVIKTGFIHNRVIITETGSNLQGAPLKTGTIAGGDLSIDSFNALPRVNIPKGDNPYEIAEDHQTTSRDKTVEEKKKKFYVEKKKNDTVNQDYLKREMYEESRSSRCGRCNIL